MVDPAGLKDANTLTAVTAVDVTKCFVVLPATGPNQSVIYLFYFAMVYLLSVEIRIDRVDAGDDTSSL